MSTPSISSVLASILVILCCGCARESDTLDLTPALATQAAAPTLASPPPAPPPAVRPAPLPAADPDAATIPGLLVADHKAAIGSQLTGQVIDVRVQEGDRVRAGQVVIRLDDRAPRLEVAAAQAALLAARRRLTSGTTGAGVTANEVDQLITHAQGDWQVAVGRREAARAALDAALEGGTAEIDAARAEKEAADERLARLRSGSRPREIAAGLARVTADQARHSRAADEARRMRELFDKGAISEQARIAADSEQQRLAAELAYSQQQLALLEEGSRPEEIREAEAKQRAAEAQLRTAETSRRRIEERRAELAAAEAEVAHRQSALRAAGESRIRVARSRQDADALEGDLRLASANLSLAQARLRQTVLRSPITGQVTHRQVQLGDSVTADQRVLLEVVDPSSLHVEIAVNETELPRLRVGMPVWVAIPSRPGGRIPGRLESLGAAPRGNVPGYVGRVRLFRLPAGARAGMLANVYLQPG